MCPALILAAKRNAKVNGRTTILVVSIKIKKGFNQSGAPSGRMCAIDDFIFLEKEEIINVNHKGNLKLRVIIRCLLNLKV